MDYRRRSIAIYKELHRLGRDHDPAYNFHSKLRRFFERNRDLTDPAEIERAFQMCEYIKQGMFRNLDFLFLLSSTPNQLKKRCLCTLYASTAISDASIPLPVNAHDLRQGRDSDKNPPRRVA
ncbi:hypothetical protein R3P38DRAFT_178902 [Favolaschia claudopus]|uniref:Uncharacterized protein n=1 Tax=Favolaschia claudopus TaxID=2862362 RepID=A0AAW0D1K4_9AGAR